MRSPVAVVALALALTATITILNAAPVTAQSGVTIFAGAVSSNFSGDSFDEGSKSKIGFAAGLGLERAMSNGLSFNPELMFVMKGLKEDDGDGKLELNYIEVPLMFRYHFQSGGSAQPFITAGPTIGYALSCNIKDTGDSESCDDAFGEDNSFKDLDFGLAFGAGVMVNRLTISARYGLGLANIEQDADFTTHNRALMVLLGIGF